MGSGEEGGESMEHREQAWAGRRQWINNQHEAARYESSSNAYFNLLYKVKGMEQERVGPIAKGSKLRCEKSIWNGHREHDGSPRVR